MLRRGTEIQFKQMDDFTGDTMEYKGKIIGHAKEARKMWPIECGEVINPVYLVECTDSHGNIFHHMVFPEELFYKKEEKE